MNRPSALFYAIIGTAIYVFVLVVLHGELAELPGIVANRLNLNLLGDSIGGLTAPVALIWLIAAVVTQRQELNLTKQELEKTADAMERQVELMTEQSIIQKAVASSTYKVTMFQERYALYRWFTKFPAEFVKESRATKLLEAIENFEKVKYVFGSSVFNRGKGFHSHLISLYADLGEYEELFGYLPVRDDDGVLVFFSHQPDDEQDGKMNQIDTEVTSMQDDARFVTFLIAMRKTLELDTDIDFQKGVLEAVDQHGINIAGQCVC